MLFSLNPLKPWHVVSASVRGTRHEKTGQPCQDAHEWRVLPGNVLVAAVADGAGSAALAEVGSIMAVKAAVEHLQDAKLHLTEKETDLRELILAAMKSSLAALVAEADRRKRPLRDLATTLIVFVAAPSQIAAAQIGDGAVVIEENGGGGFTALTGPGQAEYLNETTFLTSSDALDKVQFAARQASAAHVAAFSDGLQMLALKMPGGIPHPPFFTPLWRLVDATEAHESAGDPLTSFLRSPRIGERTDDDLTLLLAAHH